EIQARNVIIRLSSGQEYDLSTIDGELLFNVQSSFTRADGRRIKERMIAAKIKRAKQGHKACGIVPYGYTVPLKGDKILQMAPEQAAIVQRIFREAGQGKSLTKICQGLNADGLRSARGKQWKPGTLVRMLGNPVYLGTMYYGVWQNTHGKKRKGKGKPYHQDWNNPNAIIVPNAHPAIISEAQMRAVKAQHRGTTRGTPSLLTGLLKVDGHPVHVTSNPRASYYRPAHSESRGGRWIRTSTLDEMAWNCFVEQVQSPKVLGGILALIEKRAPNQADTLKSLEAQHAKITARLARLGDAFLDGDFSKTEFHEKKALNERTLQQLAIAIRKTEASMHDPRPEVEERYKAVRQALRRIPMLQDKDERRALMRSLVKSIEVETTRGWQDVGDQGRNRQGMGNGVANMRFHVFSSTHAEITSFWNNEISAGTDSVVLEVVRDGVVLPVPKVSITTARKA